MFTTFTCWSCVIADSDALSSCLVVSASRSAAILAPLSVPSCPCKQLKVKFKAGQMRESRVGISQSNVSFFLTSARRFILESIKLNFLNNARSLSLIPANTDLCMLYSVITDLALCPPDRELKLESELKNCCSTWILERLLLSICLSLMKSLQLPIIVWAC